MSLHTKIRFFSFIMVLAASLSSCSKEKYDVIPDVYVSFTMDIQTDIEFASLTVFGNHVIVTSRTNNWGINSAGYNNNGIIVFRLQDEFKAYDRTCPHDYEVNGTSIKVNVDFIDAVCPSCSTRYSLSANGTPISGVSRYPLKNYKTSFDGRYLSVWNN
jgi:nitrite reductase/ring-hydroxylating ferredoxin subunit